MKKIVIAFFMFSISAAFAEVPVITDDSVSVVRGVDRISVSYTLADAPAVVTVQFQTNGVDMAATDFSWIVGDVATVVQPGDHSFVWYAAKATPGIKVDDEISVVVKAWPTNAPPPFMVVDLSFPGLADRNDGHTNYIDAAGNVTKKQLRDAVTFYASESMLPGGQGANCKRYKTDFLLFKKINAANVSWWMGSPDGEEHTGVLGGVEKTVELVDKEGIRECCGSKEYPHVVTLANDYYMGVFEVTQAQLLKWCPSRTFLSSWSGVDTSMFPADNVSYAALRGEQNNKAYYWPDAGHTVDSGYILGVLRGMIGSQTDYPFDLPTEAQWEFAARGGCGAAFQNGVENSTWNKLLSAIDGICRYQGNGGDWKSSNNPKDDPAAIGHTTAVVGSYDSNGYGLYDVHGNVAEFCLDNYKAEYYADSGYDPETGPDEPDTANDRCHRGGYAGSSCYPHCLRLGKRSYVGAGISAYYFGFRLCCPARAVFAPLPTY